MKKFYVPVSRPRQYFLPFLFAAFFSGSWCVKAQAQSIPDSISKADTPTRAMLAHYSAAQLEEIKLHDPEKYQTIFYYYTRSYLIETFDCSNCVPRHDFNDFDVFRYEPYRQQSARYILTFEKYGYRVVLLSIDELIAPLPLHQH